jgi:hypothetical protein
VHTVHKSTCPQRLSGRMGSHEIEKRAPCCSKLTRLNGVRAFNFAKSANFRIVSKTGQTAGSRPSRVAYYLGPGSAWPLVMLKNGLNRI